VGFVVLAMIFTLTVLKLASVVDSTSEWCPCNLPLVLVYRSLFSSWCCVFAVTERPHKVGNSDIRSRVWCGQWIVHLYSEHYRCRDCWVGGAGCEALCVVFSRQRFLVSIKLLTVAQKTHALSASNDYCSCGVIDVGRLHQSWSKFT